MRRKEKIDAASDSCECFPEAGDGTVPRARAAASWPKLWRGLSGVWLPTRRGNQCVEKLNVWERKLICLRKWNPTPLFMAKTQGSSHFGPNLSSLTSLIEISLTLISIGYYPCWSVKHDFHKPVKIWVLWSALPGTNVLNDWLRWKWGHWTLDGQLMWGIWWAKIKFEHKRYFLFRIVLHALAAIVSWQSFLVCPKTHVSC